MPGFWPRPPPRCGTVWPRLRRAAMPRPHSRSTGSTTFCKSRSSGSPDLRESPRQVGPLPRGTLPDHLNASSALTITPEGQDDLAFDLSTTPQAAERSSGSSRATPQPSGMSISICKRAASSRRIAGRPGRVDQADLEHVAEMGLVLVAVGRELHPHQRHERQHPVGTERHSVGGIGRGDRITRPHLFARKDHVNSVAGLGPWNMSMPSLWRY